MVKEIVTNDFAAVEEVFFYRYRCRRRTKKYEKRILWNVSWKDGSVPRCSCNANVYSGLPCLHIISVAKKLGREIPLDCQSPRFPKVEEATNEEPYDELSSVQDQSEEEFVHDAQMMTKASIWIWHLTVNRKTKTMMVMMILL